MVGVVGAGITLPLDVEPYTMGDSEYAAGKRLLHRAVSHLGPRFANYVVADAKFATAPFLHCSDQVGLPVIARLKQNLPELAAAVEARFSQQPPPDTFLSGEDRIEIWDAADFDPRDALDWTGVRVLRYRQHKKNGTIIQAGWLTIFPVPSFPHGRCSSWPRAAGKSEPRDSMTPGICTGWSTFSITTPTACWSTGSSFYLH